MTHEEKVTAMGKLVVQALQEFERAEQNMPDFAVPAEYSVEFALEGRAWRLSIEPVEA